MNGCHIGVEDRPIGFADAQLAGQLLRAQPAVVVFVQALLVQLVQVGAKGRFLLWITCRAIQHAAFAIVAVDVLTFENALHFIGNAMQQVVGGAALLWRAGCEQAVLAQQVAHQPATVAARGAEAGDVGLNDGDVQLRCVKFEVVGGPQPGITGADDADVHVQVLLQGRTRAQRLIQLVHPKADLAPCLHCLRLHFRYGLWTILEAGGGRCLSCVHAENSA
ncbi:hypothetical protein D3C76_1148700 [compost metagenome]